MKSSGFASNSSSSSSREDLPPAAEFSILGLFLRALEYGAADRASANHIDHNVPQPPQRSAAETRQNLIQVLQQVEHILQEDNFGPANPVFGVRQEAAQAVVAEEQPPILDLLNASHNQDENNDTELANEEGQPSDASSSSSSQNPDYSSSRETDSGH